MATDLNSASLRELQKLPGIGPVIAQRIIAARPFKSFTDLQQINGIGTKRYLGLVSDRLVSIDSKHNGEEPSPKSCERVKPFGSTRTPLVDINHASATELMTLRGIGPVLAKRVVDLRPYYRKDGITAVRGIGLITYEKMKDQIKEITPSSSDDADAEKEDERLPASPSRRQVSSGSSPPEIASVGTFTSRESLAGIRQSVFVDHPELSSKLLVASWNIRNISKKKDVVLLHRIVEILSEFDLVALQEVRDTIVLKRLKNMMPGWDYIASPPVGTESESNVMRRTEHFAFFYRRTAFAPVDTARLSTSSSSSVRPPFIAHFETCGTETHLQLTLVNVHVVCGDNESKQQEIDDLRTIASRIRMQQEPAHRRNLILLGDFNLAPQDIGRMTQGGCQFEALIRSPMSTTVSGKLYDNIWMDAAGDWPADLEIESGVYRFDWVFFPDSRSVSRHLETPETRRCTLSARTQCTNEISDHCPVWLALGGDRVKQEKVETEP